MAEDWASDVKKYAPDADDAVIAAIVRYCGIALRNRDSSLVSFRDAKEVDRVRDNFCRKKLGLTDPDPVINDAIERVGERMKGDTTRNRVTVYYLLAETFGKLGLFGGAAPVPTSTSAAAPAMTVGASGSVASAAAAQPAMVRPGPAGPRHDVFGGDVSFALAGCGLLGAIILGTATLGTLVGNRMGNAPDVAAPAMVAAAPVAESPPAAVAVPAIPDGAGVVARDVEGKPLVSVYFDTAKTDIAPDFATVAAPVKAWLDGHPGARVAVSGFNDSRGNAAFNAKLSKDRAKAVAAALTATGVLADVIDLEKPPETTDTSASASQARRVDIVVKDAG